MKVCYSTTLKHIHQRATPPSGVMTWSSSQRSAAKKQETNTRNCKMLSRWETSRIIRFLVTGLQVFGAFPYRWKRPHPHCYPEFSAALFLWVLFTKLAVICDCVYYYYQTKVLPLTSVGEVAWLVSYLVSKNTILLVGVLLTYYSPQLKTTLVLLNKLYDHNDIVPYEDMKRKLWSTGKFFILPEFFVVLPLHVVIPSFVIPHKHLHITYEIMVIFLQLFNLGIYLSMMSLFSVTLLTLGIHLSHKAAITTQVSSKQMLFLDCTPTTHSATSTYNKMISIFQLEQAIRKVSKLCIFFYLVT